MRLSYAVSLLPLAAFVGALEVTSPKKGEDVDLSSSFTVTWDSVSTDPTTFDLYLVNNAVYPTVEKKVASDVETSKGSYTVSDLSGVTDGSGYQINLLSTSSTNSGILAQSEQFTVEGGSSSSSTTTASASMTTSASTSSSSSASSTGTSTASSTRSASASGTSTASASGTETTAPASTGAGMALAAPVSVAAGLVLGVVAMQFIYPLLLFFLFTEEDPGVWYPWFGILVKIPGIVPFHVRPVYHVLHCTLDSE
ncbi:glutathione-dependent formaldehyde-activating enzyme family protein [Aspergillus niger]|nr:glutathione-dependent formaldehyde-activating enzyme family protein [Aspergillus niger]